MYTYAFVYRWKPSPTRRTLSRSSTAATRSTTAAAMRSKWRQSQSSNSVFTICQTRYVCINTDIRVSSTISQTRYTHTHTYSDIHTYIQPHTTTHTHTHTHIYIYIHTYIYILINTRSTTAAAMRNRWKLLRSSNSVFTICQTRFVCINTDIRVSSTISQTRYTYTHTYSDIHTHIQPHTTTHTHTYVYIYTYTYIYIYANTY